MTLSWCEPMHARKKRCLPIDCFHSSLDLPVTMLCAARPALTLRPVRLLSSTGRRSVVVQANGKINQDIKKDVDKVTHFACGNATVAQTFASDNIRVPPVSGRRYCGCVHY
jgi:hypothetical protein